MDSVVITIRYQELSAGAHGKAACAGRSTTIYLLPGLTGTQRRAALRRLRQEARMRCGPRLPLPQLAAALVVDRIWLSSRQVVAVVRLHPAGSLLPAFLVAATVGLFLLAAVPGPLPSRPPSRSAVSPEVLAGMTGGGVAGKPGSPPLIYAP